MKILAINGSPRGKKSNTDKFILPFLEGAQAEGASFEVIYLSEKNIKGCQGCFSCWVKTPGKCQIKDDMQELMDKINQADVLIFATPLYFFSMTGQMKTFVDRLLPVMEPFFVEKNGRMGHPRRRKNPWKVLLFSNEGFIEKNNFDILVDNFQIISRVFTENGKLDATILRTTGETIGSPIYFLEAKKIKSALEQAGKEFVKDGQINPKTQEIIEKQLFGLDKEKLIKYGNKHWHNLIKKNQQKTD